VNTTIKIIFAVVITALLVFFLTREFIPVYVPGETKSDTVTVSDTVYVPVKQHINAVKTGGIKKRLIDSSDAFYNALNPVQKDSSAAEKDTALYVYESVIDTTIAIKDSSGRITNSVHAASVFTSPVPLDARSVHSMSIDSYHLNEIIKEEKTITETIILEENKSFFNLWGFFKKIKFAVTLAPGYGFINKVFDVFAGVGLSYEL